MNKDRKELALNLAIVAFAIALGYTGIRNSKFYEQNRKKEPTPTFITKSAPSSEAEFRLNKERAMREYILGFGAIPSPSPTINR